jgi:hypothetical protein
MKAINLFKGLTVLALLSSCVSNELEQLEDQEKKLIAGFLAANPGYEKTEGGIYFKEEVEGTGLSPVDGDYIFIHFTGWYIETGTTKEDMDIRETSLESRKDEWNISGELEDYLFGPSKITYGDKMPGINEALGMMKEGGKASFVLPSDKANFDYIPLLYEIELIKVVRDPIAYEDSVLNFIVSRDFSEAEQVDDTTVWMKITESSVSDEYYTTGDTLLFNFTGRLVDGFGDSIVTTRIIDSNTGGSPVKIVFGKTVVPSGSMITTSLLKGLTMAFDSIQSGVKASVLMHYNFAFSDKGLLHPIHKYIIIPEYQTVVYDIEVVQIKPMAGK